MLCGQGFDDTGGGGCGGGEEAKHEFADLEWDISISVSSIKPPWLVDSN